MRISKCITISLIVALAATAALGQDQPAARSQTAPRGPSNTRQASCLVRITVDPAILLLDQGSIEGLLQSSGVVFKAGREVLSLTKPEDFARPLVTVEWLNLSAAPRSSAAGPFQPEKMGGYDVEMVRRMEQIYGRDYRQLMGAVSGEQKKDGAKEDRPGESPQRDGASDPGRQNRSDDDRMKKGQPATSGMAAGGAVGGMGGMGMGGGMMGGAGGMGGMVGYGGGGGMGFYGAPALSPQEASGQRSATVRLSINLPENVPPLADEFLQAVVRNLEDSLSRAHESYLGEIERALAMAKRRHRNLQSEADGTADEVSRVQQRLDQVVDLSALQSQMPLSEAVEVLRKSVVPPLNIVVFWTDVKYQLSIEPTTPINIDGLPQVKMGTALDLLVKGLIREAKLMWRIKDDTIVIGTAATLGQPLERGGQPRVETDAVNLGGQRSELVRKIHGLELDLAGMDARREAVGAQIASVRQRVNEKLSQDPVAQELETLARMYGTTVGKDAEGRPVPRETPNSEHAIRARIELASRREELSKQVGGGQLEEFNKELSRLAIDKAEKEAQLQIVRKQLDQVQRELSQALAFVPEAARVRLAQEALDLAGRRVTELETRLASVGPPMVTMIGAN